MTRLIHLSLAVAALAALGLAAAGSASARTVWLCKPGAKPDPCDVSLATTVFSPTLHKLRVIHPERDTKLMFRTMKNTARVFRNAISEEVVATVAKADHTDVSVAVAAARDAFDAGPWPRSR